MKIAIYAPETCFTSDQQKKLASLGIIVFSRSGEELTEKELLDLAAGSDIIAPDPDNFGGFEKARPRLTKVIESLPSLKAICLSTTSFGWIDLELCRKRKIPVTNVPGYSREAVAEQALAMLLCLAKNVILTDRRTQKGKFKLELGTDLKGKTLGIIGLGNIGSRVAELGLGMGMNVIAYNRSPKKMAGIKMVPMEKLIKESDAISIHATHEDTNRLMVGKKEIAKMKSGVLIINTVDRELTDEKALAEGIKSGKIGGYAYEAEDLKHTPLAGLEKVVDFKGFGWYTKETMVNLYQIWVGTIVSAAKGKVINRVE